MKLPWLNMVDGCIDKLILACAQQFNFEGSAKAEHVFDHYRDSDGVPSFLNMQRERNAIDDAVKSVLANTNLTTDLTNNNFWDALNSAFCLGVPDEVAKKVNLVKLSIGLPAICVDYNVLLALEQLGLLRLELKPTLAGINRARRKAYKLLSSLIRSGANALALDKLLFTKGRALRSSDNGVVLPLVSGEIRY